MNICDLGSLQESAHYKLIRHRSIATDIALNCPKWVPYGIISLVATAWFHMSFIVGEVVRLLLASGALLATNKKQQVF